MSKSAIHMFMILYILLHGGIYVQIWRFHSPLAFDIPTQLLLPWEVAYPSSSATEEFGLNTVNPFSNQSTPSLDALVFVDNVFSQWNVLTSPIFLKEMSCIVFGTIFEECINGKVTFKCSKCVHTLLSFFNIVQLKSLTYTGIHSPIWMHAHPIHMSTSERVTWHRILRLTKSL